MAISIQEYELFNQHFYIQLSIKKEETSKVHFPLDAFENKSHSLKSGNWLIPHETKTLSKSYNIIESKTNMVVKEIHSMADVYDFIKTKMNRYIQRPTKVTQEELDQFLEQYEIIELFSTGTVYKAIIDLHDVNDEIKEDYEFLRLADWIKLKQKIENKSGLWIYNKTTQKIEKEIQNQDDLIQFIKNY